MGEDLLTRFTNALDCCGTCAGGVLMRRDREIKAQAWDEGWQSAYADHRDNPYRSGATTAPLAAEQPAEAAGGQRCPTEGCNGDLRWTAAEWASGHREGCTYPNDGADQ